MLDREFVICESRTNGNRIIAFYICVGDEFLEAELEFGGLSIPLSVGTSHLSLPMLHVAIRI